MDRTNYTVRLKLDSYIAEPYWPALDDVITIQKKSGMNRAKSEAKRDLALKSYLKQEGMTLEDYQTLVKAASQKWYKNADGKIVVPRHHFAGCLVQAVATSPAAVRGKFDRDSFRHHVRISDFVTDRESQGGRT